MTTTSTNLGLILYNSTTDQSGSFINWSNNVSGSSNSNMVKIDVFSSDISGSLTDARSQISGSITTINSDISTITSSISTLTSSVNTLNLKLQKLDEFSGAGQADFSSIPQNHKHLLIMGVTTGSGNVLGANPDVGCDFNSDANSSNYYASTWQRFIGLGALETFISYSIGGCLIGNTTRNSNYPSGLFTIIPDYSATSGFYKTSMGFTSHADGGIAAGAALTNGVWKSVSAITRIRVFITGGTSQRINFNPGTVISLYGFG
jgi:hypothetical protein